MITKSVKINFPTFQILRDIIDEKCESFLSFSIHHNSMILTCIDPY